MSTDRIYKTVVNVATNRLQAHTNKLRCLDIGAGGGDLLQQLSSKMNIVPCACDYHTERFKLNNVPIEKVNLNTDILPYPDNAFDLVTCSEVIEHVENYRRLLREAKRVLKKGGLLILTTPNVLNMKSRLRYFITGFFNLFGPLPFKNDRLYSTAGHITPIQYFYLAHALSNAEFINIQLTVDKFQRTSAFLLALAFPFIAFGWLIFHYKEKNKYKTLTETNVAYVKKHFSISILVGRTIVISAVK